MVHDPFQVLSTVRIPDCHLNCALAQGERTSGSVSIPHTGEDGTLSGAGSAGPEHGCRENLRLVG